jgi:hypothetical protein
MNRSHSVSILKIVTLLLLTGSCAACAGGLSQTPSASDLANLDNDAPKSKSSSGNDASSEQRNRDIVQSVTGRTM